ncbi:MAG: LTA synthase family protein, partial [Bacteroidota bacterium]|nr:LTA synthase family protein [Bacteroidota bacterium]
FKSLCDSGLFFDRCFSPTFGTARGVFAILSGTPDVQLSEFSSRDPEAVHQRTIINDFTDYSKFYFLGGNSDFNNFKGLVENIHGVHIYQEGDYDAPVVNVWGISDKRLFWEADRVLSLQKGPFFALIQTADNHRPYTIPAEDSDFEKKAVPEDTLNKYGFSSEEEYESFRYTDYCFRKFFQKARTEPWYNNTIFVFVGDHGLEGNAAAEYAPAWDEGRLTDEHIPLLFYAPELITPSRRHEVVSQVDVLPTLAGMVDISYRNSTIGRDLLHVPHKWNAAFIIHHDEGNIGVVTDHYYFVKNLRISKRELYPLNPRNPPVSPQARDSIENRLSALTSAIYETSKYLLIHNKN